MRYDHMVKVNGKYYQAGEDVPEVREMAGEETPKEDKQYTKTDIKKMTTADLQSLAAEVGIENAFETSGEKLKEILIEYFGL